MHINQMISSNACSPIDRSNDEERFDEGALICLTDLTNLIEWLSTETELQLITHMVTSGCCNYRKLDHVFVHAVF